jgi:hypothetical protein
MNITIASKGTAFHAQYRPGNKYKFMMLDRYGFSTDLAAPSFISTRYATLSPTGLLVLEPGYAWDGASGPAIDTPDFIRGSAGHDALYQFIRLGLLDMSYRQSADSLLHRIILEDDMYKLRAAWVYAAVRMAGRIYMKG